MPQLDSSRVSTAKLMLSVVVDGDYYGGSSAAVPFKWESQPGTPRRSSSSGFNSPVSGQLTPPPSYFYASPSSAKPKSPKKSFGSFRPKNRSAPSSPAASSSSSSSSSSLSYGSKHYNAKSSGCYASIVKVLLR